MATVLIPLPSRDFDPTESAIPWRYFQSIGLTVVFATPDGRPAEADARMLNGAGLGILAPFLMARSDARSAYREMASSPEFGAPIRYDAIELENFRGLLLPGGHAPGMKAYLESERLKHVVCEAFDRGIALGAICHGVVLAARSRGPDGRSVLRGRKTTALPAWMEMSAWLMTCAWLGNYYRTYPITVEAEVRAALRDARDFQRGPRSLTRDHPAALSRGFVVRDGNYLSARWPGDAHRFAREFAKLLA